MLSHQVRDWLDTEEPTQLQIKRGQKAKNRLISSNLRLVGAVVGKYRARIEGTALDKEDLFQAGALGLNRAAEKFDAARGYKFSTYSYWWISQGITKEIEYHKSTIRTSVTAQQVVNRWRHKPHDQTMEEFCEQFNYSPERVLEFLALSKNAKCTSLDHGIKGDGNISSDLIEIIADNKAPDQNTVDYEEALQELQSIPEVNDALALFDLSRTTFQKDMAPLIGCKVKDVSGKIKDAKAIVREHMPKDIRELICGPEENAPYLGLDESELMAAKQIRSERVLAVAGHFECSPMPEITAPVMNNHHQENVQELEKLVSEIQAEPEVKPKRRRGRRTKAEIEAAAATAGAVAPVKPQAGIAVKVNGMDLEGQATDIAALLKALQG